MAALPQFHRFRPRLLDALKGYDGRRFVADVSAGLTVGVVALPLAMAFAIASGVKPEQGLVTAIVAGFLISALGGSNVQIGGPAGAFIVIGGRGPGRRASSSTRRCAAPGAVRAAPG